MKTIKLASLGVVAVVIAVISWRAYVDFRNRAFESSGREFAKSCSDIQIVHKKHYGKYLTDIKELRRCSAGFPADYVMYFNGADLPEKYRSNLPMDDHPFVSETGYQLLLAIKHRYRNETFFWIVRDEDSPKLLSVRIAN